MKIKCTICRTEFDLPCDEINLSMGSRLWLICTWQCSDCEAEAAKWQVDPTHNFLAPPTSTRNRP